MLGMDDAVWQRRCALCGALDADHAYPAPEDGQHWECPRCEAVRALWEPVAAPERRRLA